MRWLVHGTMSLAVADALRRHGHTVEQIDPAPEDLPGLLKAAHQRQLDIVTNDASLVSALSGSPIKFGRSIVFLQLEGADVEQDDAIDRLFARYKRLTPGRIYTVTASRVKVRQVPGGLAVNELQEVMMALLVTGSIGIDTVETPFGKRQDVIGGSAIYFSYAASFFTPVRLVGVVGDDFPASFADVFKDREVDTVGLERRKGSKTFRWHGSYVENLNEAVTVEVDLNVLAERAPKIPPHFLDSKFVFLANTHPVLQQEMLASLKIPKLVVADTMNLWIQTEHVELRKLLQKIHGLVLNDGEARLLTGQKNLIAAAREVLKMGPKFVVIKKGEHGCVMASSHDTFVLPAFPADRVVDPTGAGDSFAGGMMGYLATQGTFSSATIKRALAFGTVVASFTIADFSFSGLQSATRDAIDERWHEYKQSMSF